MIERDLELTLHDLAEIHVRHEAPADVREDARLVPLTAPEQRSWMPPFPERRFQSMFSATKFVVAGAIVALFGGFLLGGVLTTPQGDGMAPAAVSESPSPMTTEELLSGMVTEEVEPGVYRVVNDGVRDLQPNAVWGVVVGQDGSVWLENTGQWLQLGEPDSQITLGHVAGESGVAPDGSLWGIAADNVYLHDGTPWTKWSTDSTPLRGLAIAPDGAVWVTGGELEGETTGLYRLADGDLKAVPDWADVYPRAAGASHLAVAPDGAVWLIGEETPDLPGYDNGGPRIDAFLRFDGDDWEAVAVPDDLRYVGVGQSFDIGADGTLWAAVGNPSDVSDGLARLDDSGWTVFTEADGIRPWGLWGFIPADHLHAAPDGSVWVNAEGDFYSCAGVANFDGTAWRDFLSNLCVHDMDIAPDGAVWVQAGRAVERDPADTYVITHEALAVAQPSPPKTALESLSAMVTEEVEPGVFRVINDGARDLALGSDTEIVAGYDGDIWLLREDGFLRLGSEGSHAWPAASASYDGRIFEVAPDGTIWIIAPRYPLIPGTRGGTALRSADGEVWVPQTCPDDCAGITVAPDGTVWSSWRDEGGTWRVGHLGATGWEPLDGSIPNDFSPGGFVRLTLTDSGDLYGFASTYGDSLYRYDDGAWYRLSDLYQYTVIDVGRDGTVWQSGGGGLYGDVSDSTDFEGQWPVPEDGLASTQWATAMSVFSEGLARFAQGEWTGWTPADTPDIELQIRPDPDEFGVAPDGSLWASPWCDGLVRFDGVTTDHFLSDRCTTMGIATDGSVWTLAEGEEGKDLYVITPEAAAATE